MKEENLNIKSSDLKKMKILGKGTEGTVFQYNKDILIKLYHNFNIEIPSYSDDRDIKIYQKGVTNFSTMYDNMNYYIYKNEENIKIRTEIALKKAIERKEEIKLTNLPIGKLYIDNRFCGCVLKKSKGIQIHKLIGLPLNLRRKIYLNVLKAVLELCENNIYHVDLANSPYVKTYIPNTNQFINGHSHILVNPINLKINLIDLEGKSTMYFEKYNQQALEKLLIELTKLTLEFLLKIDYNELQESPEELYNIISSMKIQSNIIDRLLDFNPTIDDLYELALKLK